MLNRVNCVQKFTSCTYVSILFLLSTMQDGATPLILASQSGFEEVVTLLVKSGAKQTPAKVSEFNAEFVL